MSGALRHFTDLSAVSAGELRGILDDAALRKAELKAGRRSRPLDGKVLAMIFDKPSTRTRVSFDVGMRQLGGETIMLTGAEMQLGRSETIADTARVLSRYVDAIMIRTTSHERLLELTEHATVPVINGLTDDTHPCQLMADVMTFEEHRGPRRGQDLRLDRRRQQRAALDAGGFGAVRVPAQRRGAQGERARPPLRRLGGAQRRRHHFHPHGRGGGDRRRLRGDRLLGVDGPGAPGQRPQRVRALPGERRADEPGPPRRAVHALPAGASRRGGHR